MRRLTFLGTFLGSLLTGRLFAQQPIVITPISTTFGPPKPMNGECPVPTCRTKHPVPSRTEMALKSQGCVSDIVPSQIGGTYGTAIGQITLANCRPYTAADMPKSIQQRCTFCSNLFVIDTVE